MGERTGPPRAEGSGSQPAVRDSEAGAVLEAEAALLQQDWSRARVLWQALACSAPPDKHYRAQLMFARAGELLAAGDAQRAREELERVLRLEPLHAGAAAMIGGTRRGRLSRLLGR
jgi:hypothetical protein